MISRISGYNSYLAILLPGGLAGPHEAGGRIFSLTIYSLV
jgi:hypothetical protein